MHDIMRFPSEKNKQKGNRDMGGDAELAVTQAKILFGWRKSGNMVTVALSFLFGN